MYIHHILKHINQLDDGGIEKIDSNLERLKMAVCRSSSFVFLCYMDAVMDASCCVLLVFS